MNTVVNDKGSRSAGAHGVPAARAEDDTVLGPEGDDLVRLGDEHVNSTESLCVGESQ